MSDDFGKITARTMLHCAYVEELGNGQDAVVVSEVVENEQGETKPNLRVFRSPKVSFWTTQVPYRTHSDKKEFEALKFLDEKIVPYKERDREIFRALNNYSPNYMTYTQRRAVQQSPYIYGGNIGIEAKISAKYKKDLILANKTPHTPTTGFFDIEQSLLEDSLGQLPLMVFTAENQVFLAMKDSFMVEDRHGLRVRVTEEDVRQAAHDIIDPLVQSIFDENKDLKDSVKKLPFQYHFFVGETEVDMIRWIFGKMHETKVSFIGIWNLGYDIAEIIKILDDKGIPHEEIFAHPDMRRQGYAYANYRADQRKVAHHTLKWHWLTATAHFQFVDSMALYSYIRTVDGKEASYALDDILKKFGLGGKLKTTKTEDLAHLQTADWHRAMLSKHFVDYAVYALWDGMSLQLLEWLNNDLTAMMLQCDITPPKFFVNQTIKVTNTLYDEWLPKGYVLGTGVDVEGMRDDDLLDEGGAVLDPQDMIGGGLKLFKEWPNHPTRCYAWVSDVDFSSLYPICTSVMNISKQTKISTMVKIKASCIRGRYKPDEAVEIFSSYLISNSSSCYPMATEFFSLPSYEEMNTLFEERMSHA